MNNFILSFLSLSNIIFSSGIIIVAFALMLYLTASNFRNSVARSFSALLAFIAIVYVGDVLLQRVETFEIATIWLKFKWIGIAFVPAEYLHFSDAVLRSTNAFSPRRRLATLLGYVASSIFLFLVVLTDLVARDGFFVKYVAAQFGAGPMFPLFAIFFFTLTAWGWYNLRKARRRCLTATTRRRMDYLSAAFIAPALGVFPYLIIASFLRDAQTPPSEIVLLFLLAGTLIAKIGVGVMITVMAYTVAYQGALSPDRIIKHNLVHYLLRGPLVATMVVGLRLSASAVPEWLGLTRETILFATVIVATRRGSPVVRSAERQAAFATSFKRVYPFSGMNNFAPLDVWLGRLWQARFAVGWKYVPRLIASLTFSVVSTVVSLPERLILPWLLCKRPIPDP
ncbi:MAG: hypothetical protein HZC40_15045, partial [Chloroflexi bacterium]|nr:hypothetical protein [Chloroflexota bacterium]